MARKKTPTDAVSNPFDKINDLLGSINPDGGMLDVNPIAKIDEWLSTGIYILNAVLSGSLKGGLPNRRSLVFAGEEGTAKTYFAMAIVREAIKNGYHPIYCDTEGAIDVDFVKRLGVDPSKVRLEIVNTVEQFSHMAAQITKMYDEAAKKKESMPKIMIVLDSLGNLTSIKERDDTTEGVNKRDMTKQQAIRKLFRVNGIQFAKYGIPFVVIAHTYDSMSMFSPKEISGGGGVKYNASIILSLGKGVLKDEDAKKEANKKGIEPSRLGVTIFVNPYKQRFARPIKVQVHIPYYKPPNPYVGLEKFVDWEHCGIVRGKCLTEKEMLKLTNSEQKKCHEFKIPLLNGVGYDDQGTKITSETRYAFPKETSRTLVVRHLNGEIPVAELFSPKVFTEKVLDIMDEKIIKPLFQLPDLYSLEEEQKDLAEILEMGDDIIDERENKRGKTRQKKDKD